MTGASAAAIASALTKRKGELSKEENEKRQYGDEVEVEEHDTAERQSGVAVERQSGIAVERKSGVAGDACCALSLIHI